MFSPPTDNLYKFLAIFGLIIVTFSFYYLFQKTHELELLLIEVQGDLKMEELKQSYSDSRLNSILNQQKIFELKMDATLLEQKHKLETNMPNAIKQISDLEIMLEKLKTLKDDFYTFELERRKSLVSIIKSHDKSKLLRDELKIYLDVARFFVILGTLFIVFGFSLWYWKVQKPADNQLLQEKDMQVKYVQEKDAKSKKLIVIP